MNWKDWVTGVIIPLTAVLVGAGVGGWLTIFFNRHEVMRSEQITRGKILSLMKHELERIVNVPQGQGKYPAQHFYSGTMLLDSSTFTVEHHGEIISLTFQLISHFERFKTGLSAIAPFTGAAFAATGSPTFLNTVRHELERIFTEKTTIQKQEDMFNNMTKKIIDDAIDALRPTALELLNEVERTLGAKDYISPAKDLG